MSGKDLLILLDQSRSWNQDHGITGMLLYIRGQLLNHKEGRFIQALEGTEYEVKSLFNSIRTDKRHTNVTLLSEMPCVERYFQNWLMGFEALKPEEYKRNPNSFELKSDFLEYQHSKKFNPSLNLLKSFYSLHVSYKGSNTINKISRT